MPLRSVFGAPAETIELPRDLVPEEKVRDGEGAIAGTRRRARFPELAVASIQIIAPVLRVMMLPVAANGN